MKKMPNIDWDRLVEDLKTNRMTYHQHFCDSEQFSGPSLHFHQRSLSASDKEKPELIYATLASWGMHRMGGGARMKDFFTFDKSLESLWTEIRQFRSISDEVVAKEQARTLKQIFDGIVIMDSGVRIVGHSKVLAHLLPDIVCPIDREYTLQFLRGLGKKSLQSGEEEFDLFCDFHNRLVFQLISDPDFLKTANEWKVERSTPWDTSVPKIIDNLIIGKVRHEKKIRTQELALQKT